MNTLFTKWIPVSQNNSQKARNHRPNGFTLVELLVVIAIVIALAALGFGLGGKAVAAAKSSKNASNLRQIAIAIASIREEGVHTGGNTPPGYFPPYAGQISAPSQWRKFTIYELIGEQAGLCEFKNGYYRWSVHPSETFLQNPLSKDLLGSRETIGRTSTLKLGSNKKYSWGGYSYNSQIEGWVASHTPENKIKRTTLNKIPFPDRTILMGEQNPKHPDTPIYFGPWGVSVPQGEYKDAATCLFVDGHVERIDNEYLLSQEGKDKHMKLNSSFN